MNATTREVVLRSKHVGNLYPVVLSRVKLLKEDEILENEMPKALKTTNSAPRNMAQVKSIKPKISKGLTGEVDPGKDDSQVQFSSVKPVKTWDRPENTKIHKLFTKKLQNHQNLTQDQAKLARLGSRRSGGWRARVRWSFRAVGAGDALAGQGVPGFG